MPLGPLRQRSYGQPPWNWITFASRDTTLFLYLVHDTGVVRMRAGRLWTACNDNDGTLGGLRWARAAYTALPARNSHAPLSSPRMEALVRRGRLLHGTGPEVIIDADSIPQPFLAAARFTRSSPREPQLHRYVTVAFLTPRPI